MNNNSQLRRLMNEHGLKRGDVARLTSKSLNTVASWLRRPTTTGYRNMPGSAMDLLRLQIGDAK